MNKYQQSINLIKDKNSKLKTNPKIKDKQEILEISDILDRILPILQEAADKATEQNDKKTNTDTKYCSKGSKTIRVTDILPTDEDPSGIIGKYITDHQYVLEGDYSTIRGNFTVNVWYLYDNHKKTEITTKMFRYREKIKITNLNELMKRDCVFKINVLQPPVCINTQIVGSRNKNQNNEIECKTLLKLELEVTQE